MIYLPSCFRLTKSEPIHLSVPRCKLPPVLTSPSPRRQHILRNLPQARLSPCNCTHTRQTFSPCCATPHTSERSHAYPDSENNDENEALKLTSRSRPLSCNSLRSGSGSCLTIPLAHLNTQEHTEVHDVFSNQIRPTISVYLISE